MLYVNAPAGPDAVALRREQVARKKAGIDAPWLNATAAKQAMATDTAGAVRLRDAFEYDPVRAALALAGGAQAAGARVYEGSRVLRTKFTRKEATVLLAGGRIRTRGVFVATGEPGTLFGQLRRHVRRLEGFAVATHPLTAAMKREVGPREGVLTEGLAEPHWLRWLPDDRILFAGALSKPAPERLLGKVLQRTAQLMRAVGPYPAMYRRPPGGGTFRWSRPCGCPDRPSPELHFHFFALARWHGDSLAGQRRRGPAERSRKDDEGQFRHL